MVLVMDDEESNNVERYDDVVLPGFRFHPTDEELVSFYLKRKVLHKSLPFELIKKVDIYKYDPWDLPKLAAMGEKEWYFYCPRDRKYRNSTRPNRVTGGGFWKATGTDRPIYSLDSTRCIGLKKSLVFYRGRAAKGVKTDWMMHEFRLPSISDSHHSTYPNYNNKKQHLNNNSNKEIPSNDAWAICRIFKKTNAVSSQRSIPQSWVYPTIPDTNQYNSQSHNTATLLASSDVLSHIATRQNLNPSPLNEPTSFTDSAAAYFASQMLGVPYNTARNSGTGDALFLRNSETGDALFLSNNENNYFNNLTGALSHEFTNVRSTVMEEETTVSEMSATSYSTNN